MLRYFNANEVVIKKGMQVQILSAAISIKRCGFESLQAPYGACSFKSIVVVKTLNTLIAGCGSVWLERSLWEREVAGSNPVTPIEGINPSDRLVSVELRYICINAQRNSWGSPVLYR